jgi:cytosine/adenosine deaminase-related metal-dependent hydrolase
MSVDRSAAMVDGAVGTEVDLLVEHGVVLAVDPDRRIIRDGAVAVRGDRIQAVGKAAELADRFRAKRTIDG